MPTTATFKRPKKVSETRMIKARPESARFIEKIAKARRLSYNSVLDILVAGFQRLTESQRSEVFGDSENGGGE
jgi:hypothetical protein